MYCRSCGKELPDDTNFCTYCGVPQRDGLKSAQTLYEEQLVGKEVVVKGEARQQNGNSVSNTIVYFLKGIIMSVLIIAAMGVAALGACMFLISGLGG